ASPAACPSAPAHGRAAAESSPLRHIDPILLVLPFVITGLGILMIYSSTRTRLERAGISSTYFVERQVLALGLGIVAMVVIVAIDYRRVRGVCALIYFATLPLLLAVLSA